MHKEGESMIADNIGNFLFLMFFTFVMLVMVSGTQYYKSDEYVEKLTDAIVDTASTSGTLSQYQFDNYKRDIAGLGDFKVSLKYEKRLGNDIYDTFYAESDIIDRKFSEGDRITIIAEQLDSSMFERVMNVPVSFLSIGTRYLTYRIEAIAASTILNDVKDIVYGYNVVVAIDDYASDASVDVFVSTLLNTAGKTYDNEVYGDTKDEYLEHGINHIFNYGEFRFKEEIYPDNTKVITFIQTY